MGTTTVIGNMSTVSVNIPTTIYNNVVVAPQGTFVVTSPLTITGGLALYGTINLTKDIVVNNFTAYPSGVIMCQLSNSFLPISIVSNSVRAFTPILDQVNSSNSGTFP